MLLTRDPPFQKSSKPSARHDRVEHRPRAIANASRLAGASAAREDALSWVSALQRAGRVRCERLAQRVSKARRPR
jgi:hypothetical protein